MPRLRVSVVIEREHEEGSYEWNDSILGQVYDYDTKKPIEQMQGFKLEVAVGFSAVGCSGPLPYLSNLRGVITYYDPTDSGITKTQYVEVTEMKIITKTKEKICLT